jgi:hypothetical protein
MTPEEIKLRLIEAAAKNPQPHAEGYGKGVVAAAQQWYEWVTSPHTAANNKPAEADRKTLGLPPKK